jgi:hypothetical protein
VDAKAGELDALVVLNGGWYQHPSGKQVDARIFVTSERLHILDGTFRELLLIPASEIKTVRITGSGSERTLLLESRSGKAEFRYRGFFAEHLAEITRRTVESRLASRLRVLR